MDAEKRKKAIDDANVHLKFCVELYRIQIEGGGSFFMNIHGVPGLGGYHSCSN